MEYSAKFEELKSKNLSLDLTRGKPSSAQLDLSNAMGELMVENLDKDGLDLRNYGEITGLASCIRLADFGLY